MRIKVAISLSLFAIFGAPVPLLNAATISFQGNLSTDATFLPPGAPAFTDADYAQWAAVVSSFHVSSTSTIQATTFSYGGGTNGNGVAILEGGFEPYLTLFDGSGHFIASTFYGTVCPAGANANSISGSCFDVGLDAGTVGPGDYQIAISAFDNLSLAENYGTGTLSDGFTGLGNLAPGEDLHYGFDVVLTPAVVTPEPRALLPAGLLAMSLWLTKRKRGQS